MFEAFFGVDEEEEEFMPDRAAEPEEEEHEEEDDLEWKDASDGSKRRSDLREEENDDFQP